MLTYECMLRLHIALRLALKRDLRFGFSVYSKTIIFSKKTGKLI